MLRLARPIPSLLAVFALLAFACEGDPAASSEDGSGAADLSPAADVASAADLSPAPDDAGAVAVDTLPGDDDGAALPLPPTDEPTNVIGDWTYVVVTPAALASSWERLADWRRRTGLPTLVVTMAQVREEASGRDDAERLRAWIRTAVEERGTQIVLLGADTPLVPHRTIYVHARLGFGDLFYETDADAATELYFSDLDGDWDGNGNDTFGEFDDGLDMRPDVAVGRVPAATAGEVDAYVDKVLAYERAEADDYQDRVLFVSEYTGFGSLDASLLLDTWDGPIFGAGFDIEKLYDDPAEYPDAAPNTLAAELRALEEGKGVVAHLGHGSEGSFAFLDIDDVAALDHAPRFNVFFSCACFSGNFASTRPATGEQYVLNPAGGGVAYVGNTDIGIGFPSGAMYLAQILRLLLAEDPPRLGEAFADARTTYVSNGGGTWMDLHADRYTMFVVDLLGDPGLRMWRGLPRAVSLKAPTRHRPGAPLRLAVTDAAGAPVAAATVTVYQPDGFLVVTRTAEDGEVRFARLDATAGVIHVTVSGDDVRPATASILVD